MDQLVKLLHAVELEKQQIDILCERARVLLKPWTVSPLTPQVEENTKPLNDKKKENEEKIMEEIQRVLEKAALTRESKLEKKSAQKEPKQLASKKEISAKGEAMERRTSKPEAKLSTTAQRRGHAGQSTTQCSVETSGSTIPLPQSSGSTKQRYKPAHVTAPFKTDVRLHKKRTSLPRSRSAARTASKYGAEPTSTRKTIRSWVGCKSDPPMAMQVDQSNRESGAASTTTNQDSSSQPIDYEQESTSHCKPDSTDSEEAGSSSLRRSASLESMRSASQGSADQPSCSTFDLRIHGRHLPIPGILKAERTRLVTYRESLSSNLGNICPEASKFMARINEESCKTRSGRGQVLISRFQRLHDLLEKFGKILDCLDLNVATLDQVCWCRGLLNRVLSEYLELRAAYETFMEDLPTPRSKDNQETEASVDKVGDWMDNLTSDVSGDDITPSTVYQIVGAGDSDVCRAALSPLAPYEYASSREALLLVDRLDELYRLTIERQLQNLWIAQMPDWTELIKSAAEKGEHAASIYRQICGLACGKLPVTLKDED